MTSQGFLGRRVFLSLLWNVWNKLKQSLKHRISCPRSRAAPQHLSKHGNRWFSYVCAPRLRWSHGHPMGFLGKSSWILKGSTRFHVPKTWIHLGCRFVNGLSVSRFENRTFNKKTGGYGYAGRKGIKKLDEPGKMVSKASYLLVCLVILYDLMIFESFLKAS